MAKSVFCPKRHEKLFYFGWKKLNETYTVLQFLDHAVPLAGLFVERSVVAILNDLERVVEAEHLGDLVDDINDETFESVVARQHVC